MLGSFEGNRGGIFIYKQPDHFAFYCAQGMRKLFEIGRHYNIRQLPGQIKIFLLAHGIDYEARNSK